MPHSKSPPVIREVDVLISGAGAAGLTLAIELARREVSFALIDQIKAPFKGSRGKGIQPRSLEIFEDMGVVDRLAAAGSSYPPQRIHTADGNYTDRQVIAKEEGIDGEPYRTPLMVAQHRTETVLRSRLAEFGAWPEYASELIEFGQDDNAVTCQIQTTSGHTTFRCKYLVGADGGRSFVRKALEIDFPGKTLSVRAIVADIAIDNLSRDAWHAFNVGDMTSYILLCPLPHDSLFQLQAPVAGDASVDLSRDGIQSLLDARLPGRNVSVGQVAWASDYTMSARLADRYRVGRVFIAGDAAHIHPPTGGQGLNTSIQDAYNLGWKLAAVMEGAPDTLLESYEEERRPIAADMLKLAVKLLDMTKTGTSDRGREVHQLDTGYRNRTLAIGEPTRSGKMPGDRAPDVQLMGAGGQPRRLFDMLRGTHWTLITNGVHLPFPAHPKVRHISIGSHEGGELLDPNNSFDDIYGLGLETMMLVRPDGYIAAILPIEQRNELFNYLNAVIGPDCFAGK